LHQPPRSILFPYTTLFRSYVHRIVVNPSNGHVYVAAHRRLLRSTDGGSSWQVVFSGISAASASTGQMDICVTSSGKLILAVNGRSEEHTSELQSRENLVCR